MTVADAPLTGSQRSSAAPSSRSVFLVTKIAGAREVIVTGEFTGWAKDRVRMRRTKPEEWHAELRLAPGQYQYRLLVDGEWKDHAEAAQRTANPFGSENCVLSVPRL
jgi:hypothetical protein